MKVLIKAGTQAWMTKDGIDAPTPFTFPKDTMVEVERGDRYWYTIKGDVADFSSTHSNIIINEVHIAPDSRLTDTHREEASVIQETLQVDEFKIRWRETQR